MCSIDTNAVGCRPNNIAIFGNLNYYDIAIYSDSNVNKFSFCNFGSSYKHADYLNATEKSKVILAGSYFFQKLEIELFTQSN